MLQHIHVTEGSTAGVGWVFDTAAFTTSYLEEKGSRSGYLTRMVRKIKYVEGHTVEEWLMQSIQRELH